MVQQVYNEYCSKCLKNKLNDRGRGMNGLLLLPLVQGRCSCSGWPASGTLSPPKTYKFVTEKKELGLEMNLWTWVWERNSNARAGQTGGCMDSRHCK